MKKFVDPRFAKGERYKNVMQDIVRAAVCPLCPKTMRWHTKPILRRYGGWLITENFNPYKNTEHHLILVREKHAEQFQQLTAHDWTAVSTLVRWALRRFKIKGGGLTLRFGDTAYTGATVAHLHFHLIVPKLKKRKAIPVHFPIG